MFATAALLLVFTTPDFFLEVTAVDCTRFSTNGSTAATYNFYRFYDFRTLGESDVGDAATASHDDGGDTVSVASSDGRSKIIAASPWSSGWNARYWLRPVARKGTIDMHYTPDCVSINMATDRSEELSTYLSLYTMRLSNGTQLASELDFAEYNVTYVSMRMSARIHGDSGAVAGFFTYHNDTKESDIEIPTGGAANELHFSNQPTTDPDTAVPIQDATFNVSMDAHQPTSTWNNYRLDWVPRTSAWYVNGVQSAETKINVPDVESMIILNLWSNGGNFSGRMDTGNQAWFDIQWVELLFNTSTSTISGDEGTVCSVETSPGSPVPNASPCLRDRVTSCIWWVVGIVSTVSFISYI